VTPEEQAALIVDALYRADAWLCTIPHGQYETYSPYRKERAVQLVVNALRKAGA
jgi:hypothetical protein